MLDEKGSGDVTPGRSLARFRPQTPPPLLSLSSSSSSSLSPSSCSPRPPSSPSSCSPRPPSSPSPSAARPPRTHGARGGRPLDPHLPRLSHTGVDWCGRPGLAAHGTAVLRMAGPGLLASRHRALRSATSCRCSPTHPRRAPCSTARWRKFGPRAWSSTLWQVDRAPRRASQPRTGSAAEGGGERESGPGDARPPQASRREDS